MSPGERLRLGNREPPRRTNDVRIGPAAHSEVERVDALQLVGGQLGVEHIEVLGDALGLHRLGDDAAVLLEVPAQHDLGIGLAELRADRRDDGIAERVLAGAIAPPGMERDATDGRSGLGDDAARGVVRLVLLLGEVRMQLDLVHGGTTDEPAARRAR